MTTDTSGDYELFEEVYELLRPHMVSSSNAAEKIVKLIREREQAAVAARDAADEDAGRRLYKLARFEPDAYDNHIHETGQRPSLAHCLEGAEEATDSFRKLAALHYEDLAEARTVRTTATLRLYEAVGKVHEYDDYNQGNGSPAVSGVRR